MSAQPRTNRNDETCGYCGSTIPAGRGYLEPMIIMPDRWRCPDTVGCWDRRRQREEEARRIALSARQGTAVTPKA